MSLTSPPNSAAIEGAERVVANWVGRSDVIQRSSPVMSMDIRD